MRLKTLLRYYLTTATMPLVMFFSFYTLGTLASSGIVVAASSASDMEAMSRNSWNTSIFAFVIFAGISGLLSAQKEARFLITRSVSRKEIFAACVLYMLPLTLFLAVLQLVSIGLDGGLRAIFGMSFRWLTSDAQSLMAPNMTNVFMFMLVSVCLLCAAFAVGFLLGSLMARWKWQTIGVLICAGVAAVGSLVLPGAFEKLLKFFFNAFTDKNSGIWLALKYLAFAGVALAVSFPVHRGLTAAKQQ